MLTFFILSLLGAVIAAGVGTFWYSEKTPMGRLHMKYLGFDKLSKEEQRQKIEEAKPVMPKIYGLQMVLSTLTSFATVFIITMSLKNGLAFSSAILFVIFNWLCFIVPTIGQTILWGNCDRSIAWKKFFFDSLYNLTVLILIACLTNIVV
jgi:hypothetical protein